MTLPYDYSRCATVGCPMERWCERKTPGRPDGMQTMFAPNGGDDCQEFIGTVGKEPE